MIDVSQREAHGQLWLALGEHNGSGSSASQLGGAVKGLFAVGAPSPPEWAGDALLATGAIVALLLCVIAWREWR